MVSLNIISNNFLLFIIFMIVNFSHTPPDTPRAIHWLVHTGLPQATSTRLKGALYLCINLLCISGW